MSRHNRKNNRQFYTFGATRVPAITRDRYYAQDWARDMRYNEGLAARAILDLLGVASVLTSGGAVTEGSSKHEVNISAAVGFCEFDVEVPNDGVAWTIPPAYETKQIAVTARCPGITDFELSDTSMTFDGTTPNYLKLRYAEANARSRTRKYGGTTYNHAVEDSYIIVCDSTPATSKDVLLATLVGDGSTTLTITQNTATAKVLKAAVADSAATASSATTAAIVPIHGFYSSSLGGIAFIYTLLSDFLESVDDTILINGFVRKGSVSLVCSHVTRISSTQIRIHGVDLTTNLSSSITVSGSDVDTANYSIAW